MDINVDQGSPQGDIGRFESGKYLYKLDSGKFDVDKFNRDFDQYKSKRKNEMKDNIERKLDELNTPPDETPPYNLSIGQIMINMKDAIFNIIDDLLNFKISWNILLKQNRLFYLGLMLIIIAVIFYLYLFFMAEGITQNNDQLKVTHVHEIKLVNEQPAQKGAEP